MKSVLVRLKEYQMQMTPAESEAVRYLLHNPEAAMELSVHELAERSFSSSATIVRMCRRLGFDGYKELRRSLQYELAVRKRSEKERRDEVSREDSLEEPCVLNDDWHSQLLQARNTTAEDVGLFISYSGQTVEMLECARNLKENGAKMMLITRFATSELSELSDYNLYVAAHESLFRNGAMSSRISQLNMIDILYTAFANADYERSMRRLCVTHIQKPN